MIKQTSIRHVRQILFFNAIALCFFLQNTICNASEAERQYIRSKLSFYYVADPNTATTGTLLAINADGADPRNLFGGNANMNPIKTFMVALLNDARHGGDDNIQRAFKEVLSIRNVQIAMYLYNDEQPFNANAVNNFINCTGQGGYEWPCANNLHSGGFDGFIHLGQHFFASLSRLNAYFVVLHELVHTQDLSNFDLHGFYINNHMYKYGADNSHSLVEAIPSMGNAFKEGIANAIAAQFTFGADYLDTIAIGNLYSPSVEIAVETTTPTPSPTPGASPDVWLYQQLQNSHIVPVRIVGNYAVYRFSQLPTRVMLHTEFATLNILFNFMDYINVHRVITTFKEYNRGNNSVFGGTGTLESMLTTLCQMSLPEAFRAKSYPNCADYPARKEHLLPLAFADFFTNFSSQNEEQFTALFDNGMNADLIHCYWTSRAAVQAAAHGERSLGRAKTAIAMALGINSSQLEDR